MARVFIDVSIFSQKWFKAVLEELVDCNNVTFAYSQVEKLKLEHQKALQVANFYKLMMGKKRVDSADHNLVQKSIDFLVNNETWNSEKTCNDPHIFSLVFVLPTKYIFSIDKKMAKCRGEINRVVDSKYCSFSLVATEENYKKNREKILS